MSVLQLLSPLQCLMCEVPQGSFLGPLLLSLYLLPFGSIVRKYGIAFHLYADDSQIYMPLRQENGYFVNPLLECISEIKAGMAMNFLHFNDNKTEVMLLGPTGLHITC